MSLSIVAHASTVTAVSPPASVTVTPTTANQLIVVIVNTLSTASISSTPSLTWIQQYNTVTQFANPSQGYIPSMGLFVFVWYAISTSNSPLTITISSSSQQIGIEALVINGANLNTPFESPSFPLAAVSKNNVNNITANFAATVTKNELIIAAVGKYYSTSGNISFTTSFGNPVFLDGNGSSPLIAYAYIIASNTLSNATFTASWTSVDYPGMVIFSILPSSVTNYVPFGIVAHARGDINPLTINPTAPNQLIIVFAQWLYTNQIIIYSNPPLLWKQLISATSYGIILVYYTITTSTAPITIYTSGFGGEAGSEVYEVLIISGANTINPFDQNPSLPVSFEENNITNITATFSTTSQNSLIIGCLFKGTANADIVPLSSSIGQPIIIDELDVISPNTEVVILGFNRVAESLSNATFGASWSFTDGADLAVIAIVPQQNIINSVVPQFEPSLSNATQFSSFFNPPAITNFSYSDAILPVGTQNRKYTFTLYSVTNDQLEDLFRLLQQPSVQLLDVEGVSHTVVITSISPTYTGGLVGIYQVDIEAIEQNA